MTGAPPWPSRQGFVTSLAWALAMGASPHSWYLGGRMPGDARRGIHPAGAPCAKGWLGQTGDAA